MKMRKNRIAALLLLLCLFLGGCMDVDPASGKETATGGTSVPKEVVGAYRSVTYRYPGSVDESKLTTGMSETYLILANKDLPLGSGYVPEQLTTLTCATTRTMELDKRAAEALYAMMEEMTREGGVRDILVTSAYRGYEYQQTLYNHYVGVEENTLSPDAYQYFGETYIWEHYTSKGLTGLTYDDAEKVVQTYSAKPGTSEHQTGLCIDFITATMNGELTEAFEDTPAFAWLKDNAYRFGFILRYPEDKVSVTGYTYEPWHYRFVGREAATDIYLSGICLEEYLDYLSAAG